MIIMSHDIRSTWNRFFNSRLHVEFNMLMDNKLLKCKVTWTWSICFFGNIYGIKLLYSAGKCDKSFSYFIQNPIGLYRVHLRETFFLALRWKSHWLYSARKFLVLQSKSHRFIQGQLTRNIFSCIAMKISLGYTVQESFSHFNQNPIGLYRVHLRETFFLALRWKSHWFIQCRQVR